MPDRTPGPGEVRVKVAACGVCRTDLHVIDGELPDPVLAREVIDERSLGIMQGDDVQPVPKRPHGSA